MSCPSSSLSAQDSSGTLSNTAVLATDTDTNRFRGDNGFCKRCSLSFTCDVHRDSIHFVFRLRKEQPIRSVVISPEHGILIPRRLGGKSCDGEPGRDDHLEDRYSRSIVQACH